MILWIKYYWFRYHLRFLNQNFQFILKGKKYRKNLIIKNITVCLFSKKWNFNFLIISLENMIINFLLINK